MKYSVQYSRAAILDLERVWSEVFEASRDYDTTEKYIDGLMEKIEDKALFPESGSPLYYEDGFTGYYFVVFKSYLAFYRVEKKELLVERILIGRSDYMRILHLSPEENT